MAATRCWRCLGLRSADADLEALELICGSHLEMMIESDPDPFAATWMNMRVEEVPTV
jgi:hypothetical protein